MPGKSVGEGGNADLFLLQVTQTPPARPRISGLRHFYRTHRRYLRVSYVPFMERQDIAFLSSLLVMAFIWKAIFRDRREIARDTGQDGMSAALVVEVEFLFASDWDAALGRWSKKPLFHGGDDYLIDRGIEPLE